MLADGGGIQQQSQGCVQAHIVCVFVFAISLSLTHLGVFIKVVAYHIVYRISMELV